MLTTDEKLRRRPYEYENTFDPTLINHSISNFSCNELFATNRPSRYFTSMYFNKSLAEEMKSSNDEKKKFEEEKENEETIEVDQSFFHMMGMNYFNYLRDI